MPLLRTISYKEAGKLETAEEFWATYDAKQKGAAPK